MRSVNWSLMFVLSLLVTACADLTTAPQGQDEPSPQTVSYGDPWNGAVFSYPAQGWIFCFDGDWGDFPPFPDGLDPFSWPSGWGNLVTAIPPGFSMGDTPPTDFLRTNPNGDHFQHYGFEGALSVRYKGQAYEGWGKARFNARFPVGGPEQVEVSVVGEVQDQFGAQYHLVCKDVGGSAGYKVHRLELTPKKGTR